jgi:hypothetical protein
MKITKIFGTHSEIIIKNFRSYNLEWNNDIYQDKEFYYPICQINFCVASNILNIITESFNLEILLNANSTLNLIDVKETNNVVLRIKGDKTDSYENWLNEYKKTIEIW